MPQCYHALICTAVANRKAAATAAIATTRYNSSHCHYQLQRQPLPLPAATTAIATTSCNDSHCHYQLQRQPLPLPAAIAATATNSCKRQLSSSFHFQLHHGHQLHQQLLPPFHFQLHHGHQLHQQLLPPVGFQRRASSRRTQCR